MFRSRANPTLTFALCASLVLHALLLLSFLYWYTHRPPVVYARAEIQPDKSRAAIIVDAPPPPQPPQPPPAKKPDAPKPPPPPPPKQFPHAPPPPLRDDSGEANGKGTANRSSPGEQPMQAQQGLEQAKLSRSLKPMPDDSASALDAPPAPKDDQPIAKTPEPAEVGVEPKDDLATPVPERPKMIAVADPTQAAPPPPKLAVASLRPPTPPVMKPHGSQPGRSSDTDSMPFAHANSVTFKDGQMMGRQGRRVRTTHIDFGLAGPIVASSLADPRVVLGVTVDSAGNVQNVTLLRSSGSDNIDQPAENEVYNWWFEPLKDATGKPQPDVWVVTIE